MNDQKNKNIEAIYPLSPMQQGMLFHSLYHPESGEYFEQLTCTIKGDFDLKIFENAWNCVIERNPILRTSFVWKKVGKMLQVVQAKLRITIKYLDWRDKSENEIKADFEKFLKNDRSKGFQVSKAPLYRLTILQTNEEQYKFLWSFHHILMDGWSMPLLLNELFTFYEALLGKQTVQLHRVRPYRDYINWLQQQDTEKAGLFWKEYLKGFTAPTHLNVGTISVEEKAGGYQKKTLYLEKDDSAALQAFIRKQQITMSTLINGAWALLLSRYSGEEDVVFGATFAGRPVSLQNADKMIGLFINTLPVRVKIKRGQSFIDYYQDLHRQMAAMRDFEFTPLVDIQGETAVPRDMPLFQSIVVFENYPLSDSFNQQTLRFKISDVKGYEKTNYPLTIVSGPGEHIPLEIAYDVSRFSDETVERILQNLSAILENIIQDPEKAIHTISFVTDTDKKLIAEWNSTEAAFPDKNCVHELFEIQAKLHPEKVTVSFEGQFLTYGELNRKANQLARHLRSLGVEPETLVAICVERSLEMIVGVLAVLKAGGAYIPVDPNYPQDRIAYILENAEVSILLTQKKIAGQLPKIGAKKIDLDSDGPEILQQSGTNLTNWAIPSNLAYVIYTSGSTGRPKGTLLQHLGLCNFISCMQKNLRVNSESVILQLASLSFDASIGEIFLALLSGARLHLVTQEALLSQLELTKLIQDQRITAITVPPSLLGLLSPIDDAGQSLFPALETVASVGESCPWEVAGRWGKSCRFLNGYGPTEATIGSAWYLFTKKLDTATVPIGNPGTNLQLFVTDSRFNLQPIGVPGELCIEGVGLARGYLNRPDLTAEKFIPDAHGSKPGARIYRTGDLVRFLPGMGLEFLDRIDNQVKLRGLRIELGEIEATLLQFPQVKAALVVAREDIPGEKQLVAYLIFQEDIVLPTEKIREFVKIYLPGFMVPSTFVALKKFPLNPNGKIDRKALPKPDLSDGMETRLIEGIQTPTEEMLAKIWEDLLQVKRVTNESNFFELGGHSLMATQMISRIRDAFQIELPIRELFDSSNLKSLAESIDHNRGSKEGVNAPPLKATKRGNRIALSFAQQRLWFIYQFDPDSHLYNVPAVLRLKGKLDISSLGKALNELIRRHEIFRTVFVSEDKKVYQLINDSYDINLNVIDVERVEVKERERKIFDLLMREVRRPFDLEKGPLIRCLILKLAPEEHIFLLDMHHIITDGWSINIIIQEVSLLYDKLQGNDSVSLSELPVQYADYAIWQRSWLKGEILDQEIVYWRKKLEGIPPLLELPTDRPRPSIQTFNGATQQLDFPEKIADSLLHLSRKLGTTPYIILLAVYKILLSRFSGQDDIVVGMPVANRRYSETEKMIGFFVNTLVIRSEIPADFTFVEFIRRLREEFIDCYAHQDLPFEKLVEELHPDRNLSHSPIFQAAFALQDIKIDQLKFSNLQVEPLHVETNLSKYDLTAYISQLDEKFSLVMEYNTDLFDVSTIQRMLKHFENLLLSALEDPEKKIKQLNLFTSEELNEILVAWNQSRSPFPAKSNVPSLFEEIVARQPDVPGVAFVRENTSNNHPQILTYDYLNRQANQLARYLLRKGVGQEKPVGILLDRSPDMIISVMGVLKAGGAFLPVDPTYPEERISYMIEDSGIEFLITSSKYLGVCQAPKTKKIVLEEDQLKIVSEKQSDLEMNIDPQNLAYVIYTSGSTGKPKGSMLHHRGLCNLSTFQKKVFEIDSDKRILQFASLSFDASVWEMVMALLNGATLFVTSREVVSSVPDLANFLLSQSITTLTIPPSILNFLSKKHDLELSLPNLRCLITAGEEVSADLVNNWNSDRSFFNAYGPTETTVCASLFRCSEGIEQNPPIGRPIDNFDLYILNQFGQPVPVGVPGELYIGGPGLARAYSGRPKQSAEKFVPHPFSTEPGARLYRSGDLARYLPDGNIEFLGRIDNQVKIRGFRVELGEIEAILKKHPMIQETAVVSDSETGDGNQLVAYFVTEKKNSLTTQELRTYLRTKLPDYMVPTYFINLNEMPLTSSGKIDRKALPKPKFDRDDLQIRFIAPRNDIEKKLAEIVLELLDIEKVGVMDNFFDLGGHSLLATQFISRLKATFQVEIPLRQIFETPTIEEMAVIIEHYEEAGEKLDEKKIEKTGRGDQDLNQLLEKIAGLSDEEAAAMLENDLQKTKLKDKSDD